MSFPISELVDRAVENTLRGIRAAGGYHFTLEVERYEKRGNDPSPATPGNYKCVLLVGDDEEVADEDTPIGFKDWWRPYVAQVYVFEPTEGAKTPFQTLLNVARADVEKAVMLDYTQGGVAHNTEVAGAVNFGGENEASGVFIVFHCRYRTLERDPYRDS